MMRDRKKIGSVALKYCRNIVAFILLFFIFAGSWQFTRVHFNQSVQKEQETEEEAAKGTYCTIKSNSLDGVPLYARPGGEQAALIPEGKCCQLKAWKTVRGKKWARVSYCGLTGWVKKNQLHYISEEERYIKEGSLVYVNALTEKGIRGYEEPSASSKELAKGMVYGREFVIQKLSGGWGKIEWEGKNCWISMYHMANYPGAWWKVETLSSAREINFREEAGTEKRSMGKIPEKTKLYITEFRNGWGKTEYEGKTGWVMLHYLTPIKGKV